MSILSEMFCSSHKQKFLLNGICKSCAKTAQTLKLRYLQKRLREKMAATRVAGTTE